MSICEQSVEQEYQETLGYILNKVSQIAKTDVKDRTKWSMEYMYKLAKIYTEIKHEESEYRMKSIPMISRVNYMAEMRMPIYMTDNEEMRCNLCKQTIDHYDCTLYNNEDNTTAHAICKCSKLADEMKEYKKRSEEANN